MQKHLSDPWERGASVDNTVLMKSALSDISNKLAEIL